MKKFKLFTLALFALTTLLVSCEKDSDDSSSSHELVGTWGMEDSYSEDGYDFDILLTVQFKSDKSGEMKTTATTSDPTGVIPDISYSEAEDFTWRTDGSSLYITMDGEETMSSYSVKSDKLYITEEGESLILEKR